jgi:hypothetical protein
MESNQWRIRPGSYVYGRYGGYIGFVEAASDSLLRVRGMGPQTPVYYVPTTAVIGEMAEGRDIFLGCTIAELPTKGWLHPPHASGAHPER